MGTEPTKRQANVRHPDHEGEAADAPTAPIKPQRAGATRESLALLMSLGTRVADRVPAPPTSPGPDQPAVASVTRLPTQVRWWRDIPAWALLLAVLALQASLSVRLLWAHTAFGDEALYLWAGHLEWAQWLHGQTSPAQTSFPTWFSGSPVIYPPLGAAADAVGGLTAARLLSLAFMLGATTCLYGVTARLLDRRAALFGALVFVTLAPTQSLGAFATYDAMALFLLAFATWLGVTAAGGGLTRQLVLLPAAGAVLMLADATKYATTLWTPAAIAVIAAAAWRSRGARAAVAAGAAAGVCWLAALAGALVLGGQPYWKGILQTTLARTSSTAPALVVLHESADFIGPVLVLAVFGLIASLGADWSTRFLCASVVIAVFLAPVNQARIHTTTSLYKHVDFGAWFAAVAAGYVIARVSRIDARVGWRVATAALVGVPILLSSLSEAVHLDSFWPSSAGMIAALRPIARPEAGPFLMEEFDVGYYYLHDRVYPGQISNMFGFLYWDEATRTELTGASALTHAIASRYFTVVEVDGQNIPPATTRAVQHALAETRGYKLVFKQPFTYQGTRHDMEIWRLTSPGGATP
jgi:Dolichyl-phosphate-mannose-protein mannosyltransferase